MNEQLTLAKGEVIPAGTQQPTKKQKSKGQVQQKTLADAIGATLLGKKEPSTPLPPVDGPQAGDPKATVPDTSVRGPDSLLTRILQTKRCHGSAGDTNFRMWLHGYLKTLKADPKIMAEGCIVVRTDDKSDTLFSCHIDTVHSFEESDGSVQHLIFDPTMRHIMLDPNGKSRCLGADDGAGIYIMLKMIESNVPGTYIFHTGEEKGGIGSRAMRAKHADLLDEFSRAIAFDRADNFEVICTQGGQACASLEAGADLVKQLNANGLEYEISHKGSFTDTKVYAPLIPECFNLGVGYMWQHSADEYLDVDHVERLLQACLNIQWDKLVVSRKPTAEPAPQASHGGARQSGVGFLDFEREDRALYGKAGGYGSASSSKGQGKPVAYATSKPMPKLPTSYALSMADLEDCSYDEIFEFVEQEPEKAAGMICALTAKLKGKRAEVEVLNGYFGV